MKISVHYAFFGMFRDSLVLSGIYFQFPVLWDAPYPYCVLVDSLLMVCVFFALQDRSQNVVSFKKICGCVCAMGVRRACVCMCIYVWVECKCVCVHAHCMCVCVCVCVCVIWCIFVSTWVSYWPKVYACMCMCVHVPNVEGEVNASAYVCVCVCCMCMCVHVPNVEGEVNVSACVCVCVCVCVCMCMYEREGGRDH